MSPSFNGNSYDYYDYMDCHPLRLLGTVIARLHGTLDAVWPVGLRSLRKISVGTGHRLQSDRHYYSVPPTTAGALFLLPNLEVLHLNHIAATDEDEPALEIAPRSSNLKELSLVRCELPIEEIDQMIGSARALKKFLYYDPSPTDYDELLKCLSLHHAETLEIIRFPGVKTTTSISLAGFKILRSVELPLTGLLRGKYLGTDEVESDPRDPLSSDLRQIFPIRSKKSFSIRPEAWPNDQDEATVTSDQRKPIEQDQEELLHRHDRVAELVDDKRFVKLEVFCLCKCHLAVDDHLSECYEAVGRMKASSITFHERMPGLMGSQSAWKRHVQAHKTMRSPLDVMDTEPSGDHATWVCTKVT